MLHKHLVIKYVGDSALISPSLHRVSIRHLAKAGSYCASGAGLSPGSCQTCMLYTQKSLGIDHQAYPALWLLIEKKPTYLWYVAKRETGGSQLTVHLPLVVSAHPGWGPRWVAGAHLSKSADLLLASAHQRLIWTEEWQLRHQMCKNLKISFKERPTCK